MMDLSYFQAHYRAADDFPEPVSFLEKMILKRSSKVIADLGGGANPRLSEIFVSRNGIDYSVLDIDENELAKGPAWTKKKRIDLCDSPEGFREGLGGTKFDMVFSHMLMEHLCDAERAHRNIFYALNDGGVAVHFFPCSTNLPLFVNKTVPEVFSRSLVKLFQPHRDLQGHQEKFPAYYHLCKGPGIAITREFEKLGYKVVGHTGFIGHTYYDRFNITRKAERLARAAFLRFGIPAASMAYVVLEK